MAGPEGPGNADSLSLQNGPGTESCIFISAEPDDSPQVVPWLQFTLLFAGGRLSVLAPHTLQIADRRWGPLTMLVPQAGHEAAV